MSYKQLASNLLATCWQPAGNFFFSCKGTRSIVFAFVLLDCLNIHGCREEEVWNRLHPFLNDFAVGVDIIHCLGQRSEGEIVECLEADGDIISTCEVQ